MHLVVGLGNPGSEYRGTRHNAGFMVLEEISRITGIRLWGFKFKGRWGSGKYEGENLVLLKPRTYMNLSGESVQAGVKKLKLPLSRLIVIHDDLDLPLGRIRVRARGGDGGHRGVRSIIDAVGSEDFARIRIGIGRPVAGQDPVDYVLTAFSPEEKEILTKVLEKGARAALTVVTEGVEAAMNKFNSK